MSKHLLDSSLGHITGRYCRLYGISWYVVPFDVNPFGWLAVMYTAKSPLISLMPFRWYKLSGKRRRPQMSMIVLFNIKVKFNGPNEEDKKPSKTAKRLHDEFAIIREKICISSELGKIKKYKIGQDRCRLLTTFFCTTDTNQIPAGINRAIINNQDSSHNPS